MMTIEPAQVVEHLLMRLRPINRALHQAVKRQGQFAARLARPDVTPLCITDDHVNNLLDAVDALIDGDDNSEMFADVSADEQSSQYGLKELTEIDLIQFPLERMASELGLDSYEQEAILLCAAPELDRAYERIYAYILDDLNRRYPCIELLSSLTARSMQERLLRRHALGRFGRLRRLGLLVPSGEASTELRQELRLAPGVFERLTKPSVGDLKTRFRDPAEIQIDELVNLPSHIDKELVQRLGQAMAKGSLSVLGIWGVRQSGTEEIVPAIAAAAGISLRQLTIPDGRSADSNVEVQFRDALEAANMLGAMLWIDVDQLSNADEQLHHSLENCLSHSNVRLCMSGTKPWRPTTLLRTRSYFEVELQTPDFVMTKNMWTQVLPDVSTEYIDNLAARFRLTQAEMQAVAQVARTWARINSNGAQASVEAQLERACVAVIRKRSYDFATVTEPKRGPKDLILPAELHRQVLEVGRFFLASSKVDETWGFGRMATGRGGMKALFTGDSGTGKTLAAEVIAGELNYPLLKVDLAQVVSKWVGETEKNLDAVFSEAEQSHAVLFFDEADSLFGKRGEVKSGTDRYANLEVGYLLQKLEDYYGLVILASNLKDEIDTAFIRRFQVVIHFPRPSVEERRRIWQIALPKDAPRDVCIDFEILERLDMTGAGIMSSARMAALLAASEETDVISMYHLAQAVSRQYQRESRVLSAVELGSYAPLIQGRGSDDANCCQRN